MTLLGYDKVEPYWLIKMRQAARQRPGTRFVKIRWIDLQHLPRERNALWQATSPEARDRILTLREKDNYGYLAPYELKTEQAWRDEGSCREGVLRIGGIARPVVVTGKQMHKLGMLSDTVYVGHYKLSSTVGK